MELMKIIYDGVLFPEYCKNNNISFKEVLSRFRRMRNNKKLNKFSDEYLVDYIIRTFYSQKNNIPECKYFVDEEPLSVFAKKNNVHPTSIRGAIAKGLRKNPDASVSELAKEFVERCNNRTRYTYDKYPLSYICKDHMFSNAAILKVFHENYPDSSNMTPEEIDEAIKDIVDTFIEREKKSKGLKYEI